MKRALLLLLMVCLLIAAPLVAAAYEPTNGFTLEANTYANKIMEKEEVATLMASENMTPLVLGKRAWTRADYIVVLAVNIAVAVAYMFSPTTEANNHSERRSDRVSSRFT